MSDLGLDRLMSVDEAIAIVDALPLPSLASPMASPRPAAVLVADVVADRDYPPFDKSLVDGYAVRAADVPGELPCVGEIAAGHAWADGVIPAGTCVAIMTGAPLPPGVDAIVPVELTMAIGSSVRFATATAVGRSIARRGSDVAAGTRVLRAGVRVGPAQVAVLAQLGALSDDLFETNTPTPAGSDPNIQTHSNTDVAPTPLRAHVLVTGDEVVPHDAPLPHADAIRDANGPMLASLLAALGVAATRDHVGDDPDAVRDAIDRASRESDLLFITGGVSMGRHDHVPATLRGLGFDLPITKLRMKPGKPFVVARRAADGRIVFALPGNPVSAFCCTLRLAARVIRRMLGRPPGDDLRDAPLAAALPANGPREFYQPATLDAAGRATPLAWKGSADVFTLALADALILRPSDDGPRGVDATVRVLPIPR